MSDEDFYAAATENANIEIDVPQRKVHVAGQEFDFTLTEMEYRLTMNRGMNEAYKKFGNTIWEKLTERIHEENTGVGTGDNVTQPLDERLSW